MKDHREWNSIAHYRNKARLEHVYLIWTNEREIFEFEISTIDWNVVHYYFLVNGIGLIGVNY